MNKRDRIDALKPMDPGYEDPGYWVRFRAEVLRRTAFELARRRQAARESVEAVLSGWSRRLIPVALAASVAGALLVGQAMAGREEADDPPRALALEELMEEEVGDRFFQAVISGETHASPGVFMTLVEATP